MPDPTPRDAAARIDATAGHLALRVEGAHPPEVRFSFESQGTRLGSAFAASAAWNLGILALILFAGRMGGEITGVVPDTLTDGIIWIASDGPGGGGGGGGNKMKEPPRPAELPGKDKVTVPVVKPPALEAPRQPEAEPDPVAQLTIPAETLALGTTSLPGAIEAPLGPPTPSQGSGSGGGAGTGSGSGIGPGRGSGLGPGFGGGTGGGAYQPGNGVSAPQLITEVKPQYTPDAMRARVQGTVLLRAIVRPDGTVGDVEVLRSLDSTFGLDQEAVKAARLWRFRPGRLAGQPVPVLVTIELTFTLR